MNILKIKDYLLNIPRHTLVLQLTVIFLLLHEFSDGDWRGLSIVITLIGILMLLHQEILFKQSLWFLIFVVMGVIIVAFVSTMDNHKYLIAYWTLACALALGTKDVDSCMAKNARRLVGLVFLFAFIWKMLGGEYLNGAFFRGILLVDDRFWLFTKFLTGVSIDNLEAFKDLKDYFEIIPTNMSALVLPFTAGLQSYSLGAAYWTLFIELAIAVFFLVNKEEGVFKHRDIFLLIFLFSTYLLAPVDSFAIILCLMGLSQLAKTRVAMRLTYIGTFFVFQLWRFIPDLKDYLAEMV